MHGEELFATVFVLMMFSGVFVVYLGLRQRAQQLEMRHQERMAMIERGLAPGPEVDFEKAHHGGSPMRGQTATRWMSLGVAIVAMGLALMSMISIAGESPQAGVGVGGAIVIVGLAFIVNSALARGQGRGSAPPPTDAF